MRQFLLHSNGLLGQANSEPRRDASSRHPLGMINVIFVALGRNGSCPSRVMFMARLFAEDTIRSRKGSTLSFSDEDKTGTIQPQDETLVVMLRIRGYDMKRMMVDQGSGAEIMYPNLYKGLNLRPRDLTAYDSLLVSFDGKVLIPRGQIRLSM